MDTHMPFTVTWRDRDYTLTPVDETEIYPPASYGILVPFVCTPEYGLYCSSLKTLFLNLSAYVGVVGYSEEAKNRIQEAAKRNHIYMALEYGEINAVWQVGDAAGIISAFDRFETFLGDIYSIASRYTKGEISIIL